MACDTCTSEGSYPAAPTLVHQERLNTRRPEVLRIAGVAKEIEAAPARYAALM